MYKTTHDLINLRDGYDLRYEVCVISILTIYYKNAYAFKPLNRPSGSSVVVL